MISGILLVSSFGVLIAKGLNYGIEFTGGTLIEVSYDKKPDAKEVANQLTAIQYMNHIQESGDMKLIIKGDEINELNQKSVTDALKLDGLKETILKQDSIGSSMSSELKTKSLYSILLVILGVIIFLTYAFRSVSYPVKSWKYGIIAVITLLHDIMIPVGVYVIMGLEIDTLFIVGILSILGLSLNDTIVVFDRIRESLTIAKAGTKNMTQDEFEVIVGTSLYQTISRSLNTTVVLIIALVSLLVWGPASVFNLVFVLLIGMIVGTYSSIFVASPLLTFVSNMNRDSVKK